MLLITQEKYCMTKSEFHRRDLLSLFLLFDKILKSYFCSERKHFFEDPFLYSTDCVYQNTLSILYPIETFHSLDTET
jgi:hypothetical protein